MSRTNRGESDSVLLAPQSTSAEVTDALISCHSSDTAKQVEKLSILLAGRTGLLASDGDLYLRERLYSLSENSLGERREEIFDDLCGQIGVVFGGDEPTDPQILANSATPDLVRYLVRSLRAYHSCLASEKSRARALASAMKAVNTQGNPGKLKVREVEIVDEAQKAKLVVIKSGGSKQAAAEAALAAAYTVFRQGEDEKTGGQDDKTFRATEVKLVGFLVQQGIIGREMRVRLIR